ncbi:hypothetical protein KDA_09150 [Dictyobacter alpinus]|uniref:Glycosyltransferase RgtA/B/C/D-like domain-containing protein n=1 Tax=Dictyobacter alpinus TaxID=2014873 RepID=A0A402B255_9CHLR|nr:flippase activity-associated protein Agl23 [Dictyobacter alpinus]GCE25431.1 hypothetical protein KDA_09150 [Dictyobacter alpinus]
MDMHKSTQNAVEVVEQVSGVATMDLEKRQRRLLSLNWPTRDQWLQWLPFLVIILLGALLRFWRLDIKPLHHDESLHAYFSLQLLHNLQQWRGCFDPKTPCYHYDPLLHGPFQFHIIALVYQLCQWFGVPEHGVNAVSLRIAAASLGSVIVGLPYFIRDYLGGRRVALLACFLLAISPCMVYFSRFAREDIYMACFTLLLVVSAGRYVRSRRGRWLLIGTAAFVLSYATKEATFLSIAVFGSFLIGLVAWEIGARIPVRSRFKPDTALGLYAPRTAASLSIVSLLLISAPLARWFFNWMKELSTYINANTATSGVVVQDLKAHTVAILPWIGLVIVCFVVAHWGSSRLKKTDRPVRKRWTSHIHPATQPVLNAIVTMRVSHWFSALVLGAFIFVLLFSVIFTNLSGGVGDGIWQGLYYWLQQQQVARGSQPWYYYLILIPLYEQIGLVFGLAGLMRCLLYPDRFRLFLVYWFVGTLGIYTWAGEKMPWLMIHMAMPMLLLAAIGLEPLVARVHLLINNGYEYAKSVENRVQSNRGKRPVVGTILGVLVTLGLLFLTLQNMFQVTFVHYADGPHEMMIYVQSTMDVHTVMRKIDQVDKEKYHGQHKINIGVMSEVSWPFYWYLRDYPNVCYGFPTSCANANPEVILTGGDNLDKNQTHNSPGYSSSKTSSYLFHRYHLRSWWDEGYKPRPCVPSAAHSCHGEPTWGGVGPLLWLSYGDTPPENAQFDPVLASTRIWDWWWTRKPFGNDAGATDMGFFMRSDLGVSP